MHASESARAKSVLYSSTAICSIRHPAISVERMQRTLLPTRLWGRLLLYPWTRGNKRWERRRAAMSGKRIYPANWKELVLKVRARSGDRCECMGECGLHRTHPGPRRCEERHRQKAKWAKGIVILTTAHLCQDSKCGDVENCLRHMCNRCHLRYDSPQHVANSAETRRLKKEYDDRHQLKWAW